MAIVPTDPQVNSSVSPTESVKSIRTQLISSSLWTVSGYGIAQILRFGHNLVLTRILSPKLFGVMALVQAIITGLSFVTDVGIGPSVIQNKKSEDARFLGTAWTLQILRSAGIWIACCLLAWPASVIYREPDMLFALPVAGLATLMSGFVSINIFLLNKQLHLGPQTIMDLSSQILSVVVMVILAYYTHSIWSLLIGTLIGAVARALLSHWMLKGPTITLGIDRDIAKSMFRFGRWITLSTMITFMLSQGDRLVLGRYMDKSELGVYAIGYLIPQTATLLIGTIANRVLFPIYSRLVAEGGGELRHRVRTISYVLLAVLLPMLWILMIFAQHIVDVLYPVEYHDAGWILRLFAANASVDVVTASAGPVLLAFGNSLGVLKINIARVLGLFVLCTIGAYLGGISGLILAFAAVPLINYPVIAWFSWISGTWYPWLDIVALGLSGAVLLLGWNLGL